MSRARQKRTEQQAKTSLGRVLLAGALSLVALIVAGALTVGQCVMYGNSSWKEVPARIVECKEGNVKKPCRVVCRYEVDGQWYETATLGLGESGKDLYNRVSASQSMAVYVHPDDPSRAVMSRGVHWTYWLPPGVILLMGVWGMMHTGKRWNAYKKRELEGGFAKANRHYLFRAEPRRCMWKRLGTMEASLEALKAGKVDGIVVEDENHAGDGFTIQYLEDGMFYLSVEKDVDGEATVISPNVSLEEIRSFCREYEAGKPLRDLIRGWDEA